MAKTNLAVKLVIFSVINGKLKVFLTKPVLPTGIPDRGESLDSTGKRIFRQKTGLYLKDCYVEQLYTFSTLEGSKHKIAVTYYLLLPYYIIPAESLDSWVEAKTVTKDITDYRIIQYAIKRLRWKVEYTNAVYSLLPDEFVFSQLQTTYEAVLGKVLDKRNFRKKILSLNILKSTGHKKILGRARPAEMFSFRKKELAFVEIL